MGLFDEILGDIKIISGEYRATKKTIVSSFAELAGDANGLKNEVRSTINVVKTKTNQTTNQVKKSFDIKPTKKD